MWNKSFCLVCFFNIYNQLFWLENKTLQINKNLQKPENNQTLQKPENLKNNFLEQSLETLLDEKDFLEVNQSEVQNQLDFWQENQVQIISKLSEFASWEKTLITTKSFLICAYLEIQNLKFEKNQQTSNSQNDENIQSESQSLSKGSLEFEQQNQAINESEKSESAKIISKYLKLAQDYVDNKNVSLIHAILTKLCVDL